jgi:hypothetical protein
VVYSSETLWCGDVWCGYCGKSGCCMGQEIISFTIRRHLLQWTYVSSMGGAYSLRSWEVDLKGTEAIRLYMHHQPPNIWSVWCVRIGQDEPSNTIFDLRTWYCVQYEGVTKCNAGINSWCIYTCTRVYVWIQQVTIVSGRFVNIRLLNAVYNHIWMDAAGLCGLNCTEKLME